MAEPVQEHLKESADQTKAAAQSTAHAAERTKDSADRRTELAADRTVFAAERTYAAWVRTGLVALASGIGAKKLLEGVVPGWISSPRARPSSCSAPSASSPASGGSSSSAPRRRTRTCRACRPSFGRPQPISRACRARRSARRLVWGERVVGSELARLLSYTCSTEQGVRPQPLLPNPAPRSPIVGPTRLSQPEERQNRYDDDDQPDDVDDVVHGSLFDPLHLLFNGNTDGSFRAAIPTSRRRSWPRESAFPERQCVSKCSGSTSEQRRLRLAHAGTHPRDDCYVAAVERRFAVLSWRSP